MRLIDADELIKDMEQCCNRSQFSRSTAKMCVNRAPTIDAVPVMRSTMDWIRIDRFLPEPFVSVLCYMPMEDPLPKVHEGYVDRDGIWYVHGFRRDNGEVTHWADMPEYPE